MSRRRRPACGGGHKMPGLRRHRVSCDRRRARKDGREGVRSALQDGTQEREYTDTEILEFSSWKTVG